MIKKITAVDQNLAQDFLDQMDKPARGVTGISPPEKCFPLSFYGASQGYNMYSVAKLLASRSKIRRQNEQQTGVEFCTSTLAIVELLR